MLGAVAMVSRRRRPYLAFGVAWFVGLLLPVSGILQSGLGAMADRFTYVSSIGLSIAVVWLISDLFDSWRVRPPMRAGFAATVVVAYAVAAFVEVSHYRDTETVFSHAIESTGDNWLAEEHLADTFLKAGDTAGAMRHFRRETEIAPTRTRGFTGIGQTLEAEGRSRRGPAGVRTCAPSRPERC